MLAEKMFLPTEPFPQSLIFSKLSFRVSIESNGFCGDIFVHLCHYTLLMWLFSSTDILGNYIIGSFQRNRARRLYIIIRGDLFIIYFHTIRASTLAVHRLERQGNWELVAQSERQKSSFKERKRPVIHLQFEA